MSFNLFPQLDEFSLFKSAGMFLQTYVAMSTIVSVLFAEIPEQHPATAILLSGGISNHGLYALGIAFL